MRASIILTHCQARAGARRIRYAQSIGCTSFALLGFGAVRARLLNTRVVAGALQTWIIGAIAAGAAYGLARAVMH